MRVEQVVVHCLFSFIYFLNIGLKETFMLRVYIRSALIEDQNEIFTYELEKTVL
jgi:hypothetical protein